MVKLKIRAQRRETPGRLKKKRGVGSRRPCKFQSSWERWAKRGKKETYFEKKEKKKELKIL